MLTGKFKKQTGLKLFSQPLALETQGGQKIQLWFHQMMYVLEQYGITSGPMFVTAEGKVILIADMDAYFVPTLLAVQRNFSHIIPDTYNVAEFYSVYRSFRQGATSKALNARIPEAVINMNNKWRKKMRSNGSTISMPMLQQYTDASVAIPTLVQFCIYYRDKSASIGCLDKEITE